MERVLKVLVMAGGTGGHVFPALAVAQELQARGHHVEWLGTQKGIEATIVPRNNIILNTIDIVGLRGKNLMTWIKMPFLLLRAVKQAKNILKNVQADVVLGFGGFASGPGGLAAKIAGKPLVIHEQNAVAGTTNRWLAKLTPYRLQAFPNALDCAETVGNPVRNSIVNLASEEREFAINKKPLKLLVVGGSLGARAINRLIPELIANWASPTGLSVWHQTGERDQAETRELYSRLQIGIDNKTVRVAPFIDGMAQAYEWADLVICRSGALTVSEIAAAGLPAIFIPYPYAIDDHQFKNAQWLEQVQAAKIIRENNVSVTVLIKTIQQLLSPDQLVQMSSQAKRIAKLDAVQTVANKCEEVANG